MPENRVYLIDATAFCYRAFYAIRELATSFGQPTNAIYGFLNMLNKILKENKPQYLAVCFDVSRDTFRQKKFADYKIQRPKMPDGLSSQIPLIKEVISAYGISIFEKEGFEADDIIATMARLAKEKGVAVTIISSDKDILQLVDDNTIVFSPHKDEGVAYDHKKVFERFGAGPSQISDIIALMGDDVDNIPGVKGIGEKTAAGLIKSFGSIEKLISNADSIKQEKLRKLIADNIENIKLSKELALLDDRMDLDFDLESLKIKEPDYKELFKLFKQFEFKKLLKDLPRQEDSLAEEINLVELEDKELGSILDGCDKLALFGDTQGAIVFHALDKTFKVREIGSNMKAVLANPKVKKIGHNLKKMKISFAKSGLALEGLYFDTMIAGYLLNPSKPGYSLVDIAWDYLGKAPLADSITAEKALDLIMKLTAVLEKELLEKSLYGLFTEVEIPLTSVLADMELNGIKLDLKLLSALSRDLEKRLIELIEEIYSLSGQQFNINSPKQLREVLFEKLKLPVVKRSKTGPSTDEEVLRALAGTHKLPAFLLEYRQLMKLKTTYVDALPQLVDAKTDRIHTSFNQSGTETGRLSSSNPNLQNIPVKTDIGRQIRRAIIASEKDSCLLSCDYSQIELRILAHISKDENMTLAFMQDKDIHKATASLIYGLPEDEVTDSMRETAKRVNFGIVYGLTFYGLSRDLGIPQGEAQLLIDNYFLRYPKVKEYIEEQVARAGKDGFVTTILGRRRYIPQINDKNQGVRQFAQRQAVNTPIQGSASDLIKLAMIKIYNQIKAQGLKTKMILQIHDELVFDVPDKEMKAFIALVKDGMENVMKLSVPIRVVMKKGENWLDMEEVS